MMEYTVTEIGELIEELPVIKIDAGLGRNTAETHAVVDAYEGALELVESIPAKARYGALASAGIALPADGALYLPIASNCALSAGISLTTDGRAAFAVKDLADRLDEGDAREVCRLLGEPPGARRREPRFVSTPRQAAKAVSRQIILK